ncbi:MAG TPA: ACT domain-containing protein [Coriobacteriia bacterium]|nr:ACT domain-containing protein [Coriobacteriia bacterium]
MIDQLSVFLENKSGRLAELTRALGDARINMHALMVADTSEFGMIRIICDTPLRAKELLDERGFGAVLTPVIAVEVPDAPGGLADVLDALDGAGVNVEYAYCFVEPSGEAVDVFKVDAAGAEDVLTGAGFRVLSAEELYVPDSSS